MSVAIGADVGGTFTDIIVMDDRGGMWTHKVPSTPPNFEQAVIAGIHQMLGIISGIDGSDIMTVMHGTTVATNAVLERRGARTALITTKGFRDILELRRLRVPELFNLFFNKPEPLVERALRFEVDERVSATGEVLSTLREDDLFHIKSKLEECNAESVAVCLLHAYAFPEHERKIGDFLARHLPGVAVSLSCDVLRERREYERTATTVVNSYVRPVMRKYLEQMAAGLEDMQIKAPLQVMQSSGGLTPETDAADRPVYMLESGPAAGVHAARHIARRASLENVISFDMGGTTAKASLIENGAISYCPEYEVGSSLSRSSRLVGGAGDIVRVPTIDIAEVGAGGGSIAYLDGAGSLHVGPRSAGAVPGPVCYGGGGDEPTLTDANAVLGFIRSGPVANGDVVIDVAAAREAIDERIARPLGLDILEAAFGIHRIANASTMRAISAVSTQRGRDPRDFSLIAFGGSGPIHAAGIAREFGVNRIVIPPAPGLLSAAGLLFSGVEHHDVRSFSMSDPQTIGPDLLKIWDDLEESMIARFRHEGYKRHQITMERSADLRYVGQFSEIRVPVSSEKHKNLIAFLGKSFETEYEKLYGHRGPGESVIEVVSARLIGKVPAAGPSAKLIPATIRVPANEWRSAYFGRPWEAAETRVLNRSDVATCMPGPALVDEYDSTTVIPPDMTFRVDDENNLILEPTNA